MSDFVSSVSAAGNAQQMFSANKAGRDSDPSAFMDVLDKGLGQLAQRPELTPQADRLSENLSGPYSGAVGEARIELGGSETAKAVQSSEAANVSLEDRIKGLYTELTHYQVAWKIAQNVQRDISQVLRGS